MIMKSGTNLQNGHLSFGSFSRRQRPQTGKVMRPRNQYQSLNIEKVAQQESSFQHLRQNSEVVDEGNDYNQ